MVWRPAERMTRQENDMETTEQLDKPATSGSAASTIKAEEYDLLILGSGAAGKLLSWTLAKKGMKVAVIRAVRSRALEPRFRNSGLSAECAQIKRVPRELR